MSTMIWSGSTRAAIEAVAACSVAGAGSRELAVRAAQHALASAGRAPHQIELLVNTGVYRDENIIEPAMGPFIQRGIGANPSVPPLDGTRTFAFDLANGACGPLDAIRVIDGFMRSGSVRSGLVVASDADPDPARSVDYPFAPTGGAILLRAETAGEGFAWFHGRAFGEHIALYDARLGGTSGLSAAAASSSAGAQRLRVVEHAEFVERAVECAGRTVGDTVRDGRLDPRAVDLVIAAPAIERFGRALSARLAREDIEAPLPVAAAAAHTASLAFALDAARRDGSWARARRILFVAAGAGITVSVGLYERDPETARGSAS